MPRPGPATLAALKTLFETKHGKLLPLPPKLARLYGCLRMALRRSRPHIRQVAGADRYDDRGCQALGPTKRARFGQHLRH